MDSGAHIGAQGSFSLVAHGSGADVGCNLVTLRATAERRNRFPRSAINEKLPNEKFPRTFRSTYQQKLDGGGYKIARREES